ncbi:MAG: histidine kinase, partial [Chitinophagaceae bacterium]|nr:histidine kinase [Chitinophagaceae bacterium]
FIYPAAFYSLKWLLKHAPSGRLSRGAFVLLIVVLLWLANFIHPFDRLLQAAGGIGSGGPPPHQGFGPPPPHIIPMPPPAGPRPAQLLDIVSVVLMLTVAAVAMAIQLLESWKLSEQKAALMAIEKSKAELDTLKAQVNPHFLFNVLNNMYAMAQTGHPQTAESIMHLSNLMRYITDEATQEVVPLEYELRYIEDYIALQRMRLGEKTKVVYSCTNNTTNLLIAPLLLIPLVENVFKHGVSNAKPAEIHISVEVYDKKLMLNTHNLKFEKWGKQERHGLGLLNLKRRLEQLHPGGFQLHYKDLGEAFDTQLIIKLI